MRIGTSYKQHSVSGTFDAIVIGSGIGGLTAAAMLAKHADKRVLVLERHYTAGGFTHSFQRPGYDWDVGVHYIGGVLHPRSPLRAVFDDIGDGSLEWADMGDVYDTIVVGDDRYELVKGRRAFRDRMVSYFPSRANDIDRYLSLVRDTVKQGQLYFLDKALPEALSRTLGRALRWPALRRARRTTADVMREVTSDPKLRGVLTGQYGDYGLPPEQSSFFIHALVVDHYLGGAAYPVGGASRIAASILPVIEGAGGKVMTNAEVAEILIERDRAVGVRMADGNELRAPVVISGAGVPITYGRLLPRDVAERHGLRAKLSAIEPSFAHMSLYLGLEQTAEQLGLSASNLWVYPGYDHDANVARFLADPKAPLPVAYLSFPSAKDPDFTRRHPGRATIEVVTLGPYDWFRKWEGSRWKKRGDDYDAAKQEWTERLLEPLYAQCPQLRGKIAHSELSSPLSTRHFAGHPHGEIYGLAHTPARFEQRWLRPRTPIRNLYMTGADVCSAGVGGALFGGVLTVSAVLRRDMRGAIKAARKAVQPRSRQDRAAA